MMRHAFVDGIPDHLEEGTVYVSVAYATAVHLCPTGCGNEVVTPIAPSGWTLLFDGETVSLRPSVGNWRLDCRSHYWIVRDQIRWVDAWSIPPVRQPEGRRPTARGVSAGLAWVARRIRGLMRGLLGRN
jgi:hypothetical protein